MKGPRLRILIPVAILVTILAPILRQLPAGAQLPDVWLVLLLLSIPVPAPDSWRRSGHLVILFGILRSSVTAISPFTAWAGFGMALFVRETLARRLSEYNPLLRLVTGFSAAVPLALFDRLAAQQLGAELSVTDAWIRCLCTGLLMAFFHRPARANFLTKGAGQ